MMSQKDEAWVCRGFQLQPEPAILVKPCKTNQQPTVDFKTLKGEQYRNIIRNLPEILRENLAEDLTKIPPSSDLFPGMSKVHYANLLHLFLLL